MRGEEEFAPASQWEGLVLEDLKLLTCARCVSVEDFFNHKTKVSIWVQSVGLASITHLGSSVSADERKLIKLGMHFQAKFTNFERPLRFYFVFRPCVNYRSSISSASSLLTTPK